MVVLRFQLNHLWLHRVHTEPSKQESIAVCSVFAPANSRPFQQSSAELRPLSNLQLFENCDFCSSWLWNTHEMSVSVLPGESSENACLGFPYPLVALDGRVWSPSFPSAHDRLIIPPLLVCLLCESLICLSLPRFPSFAPHSFLPFSSPTGFLCVALAAGTLCFI